MKVVLHIAVLIVCFSASGQNWRDTLDMARKAYKNQDYGQALEYYESAQKGAPDDVDLSDEMGQSAYKAREFERAEKIYQQSGNSKKTKQEKADNYHNIGNSRMKKKDYQGAIDAYKESLRQNPNDDQTRYNLSEAIRKQKEQQKNDQNNNNGGDNNNSNNGNQGDQNNNGNQGNQGDQNNNNQGNNNSGNNGNNNQNTPNGGNQNQSGEGTLQNKTVDRMLDKLMRDEAETKRKMGGDKGGNSSPKSGKDW